MVKYEMSVHPCILHYYYIYVDAAGCSVENDTDYGIAWPSTMINTNATNFCRDGVGMYIAMHKCCDLLIWLL